MKETKLLELVTCTEMKPWLSRNMLLNTNTCENGWSNFSANLIVVSLKLLELTQFTWPNLSIYFNFLGVVPRDDVIQSTSFLMRPPVIIPSWGYSSNYKKCKITIIIIIIYHDFLPTPRRGSHVKSGKTHTQSSRYTP